MPRRRCPVCHSKVWHKEPTSGLITCSEGHVLQNYRNETNETTELGPHAVRKRTLNSGREKIEVKSKADRKLYHGARARYFYFECLQLLLRKQVAALVKAWSLPQEFEVVCRDVWALHLSLLPRPPPPEPFLYAQEQKDDIEQDDDNHDVSSSSSESEKEDNETLLSNLLKRASQSESSGDESGAGHQNGKGMSYQPKVRNGYEVPAGNIAVLVLACWTMRLPVMYMDFIRLIEGYQLPYLDPMRLLPPEMKQHLARETVFMLSPRFPPSVLGLHQLTSRLARLCWIKYGIHTPEVNTAPLLWRAVRAMGGTSALYGLTKELGNVLSLPLTLHPSLAPALVQRKHKDPRRHKSDNIPPELALVACLIAVLKLIYGLDGVERQAALPTEPGCMLPPESDYVISTKLFLREKEVNVLDLGEKHLDLYIAFCERALLGNDEEEKTVLDYFPMSQQKVSEATDGNMPGVVLQDDREVGSEVGNDERAGGSEKPGRLKIFNTFDVLGAVPEQYATVLEASARIVGVAAGDIAGIVERFERRLVRIAEGERKARSNDDE